MDGLRLLLALLLLLPASLGNPNIIFILTDDQDVTLGSMTPMEQVHRLIAEQGVTFENAFVTTPICCPSRSSILTGMYLHSHGAINNFLSDGCSSARWQQEMEPITYGNILHQQGYQTFYAGKYLNEYGYATAGGTEYVPPGWDWWIGLVGNSVYYNYTMSVNGTSVKRGSNEEDYLTDVLKEYALQFLRQPHIANTTDGFLMAINPPSAHDPYTPAKRHQGRFNDVKAPRTAHFNQPSNNTKHWITRLPPAVLPQETIDNIDLAYRNRWETLLAVDELVEEVVNELDTLGILENTYIIFMSDHGFHFGQYGLTLDKRFPYEMDIRVPLVMRGPGVPHNKTLRTAVLGIDIAPTIMHIGGVGPQPWQEGESFLSKVVEGSQDQFTRSFLIEYHGEYNGTSSACWSPLDTNLAWCYTDMSCKCFDMRNNTYSCVRQYSTNERNDLYCEFEDDEHFIEMYDLTSDPDQVHNLALDSSWGRVSAITRYDTVLDCARDSISDGKSVAPCFKPHHTSRTST